MNTKHEIDLKFHECLTEHGEVEIASAPNDLNGLVVDVFDDQVIPNNEEDPISTGLKQVHLGGTPESLYELGRFLIAVSKTNLPRDLVVHYEPIKGRANKDAVHLIIHQKIEDDFQSLTRIGDVIDS